MLLLDFVGLYVSEKTLSIKYQKALRATVRQLAAWVNEPLTLGQLAAQSINEWLAGLEAASPITAANKKRHIRTLWAAASDAGLAPPVGRLRKIKVPRIIPHALTIDELRLLLRAADRLAGTFKGTTTIRRMYWRSLLLAGWDSALRISDLRSVERNWIWPSGSICIVQSKTGYSVTKQFRPETIEAIDLLMGGRKTGPIWSTLNHKNFYRNLRKLAASANVVWNFKMIRRASASYVERDAPGMGWRHLGHARPGLAESNYLDPKIVVPRPTQPPAIEPTPLDLPRICGQTPTIGPKLELPED